MPARTANVQEFVVDRRRLHVRDGTRRSSAWSCIHHVSLSPCRRVEATSSDGMPETNATVAYSQRRKAALCLGRGAAQVPTCSLSRDRMAAAWTNNAQAGQARLVAVWIHKCSVGAEGNRLTGQVRDKVVDVPCPVSARMSIAWSRRASVWTAHSSSMMDATPIPARPLRTIRSSLTLVPFVDSLDLELG